MSERTPVKGEVWEDRRSKEWVTVLHVGEDKVTVQRALGPSRYPHDAFGPEGDFRCITKETSR